MKDGVVASAVVQYIGNKLYCFMDQFLLMFCYLDVELILQDMLNLVLLYLVPILLVFLIYWMLG